MKSPRLKKYLENRKQKTEKKIATPEKRSPATEKRKTRQPVNENVIILDMPEVKDIPGQEHIRPPRMREMEDVTISSADEEGEGLLDNLNRLDDDDAPNGSETNVSETEKNLLRQSDRPVTGESRDRKKLALDDTDGEDKLNEASDPQNMGLDLDVPGAEADDSNEEIGEEDEENNPYSRPD